MTRQKKIDPAGMPVGGLDNGPIIITREDLGLPSLSNNNPPATDPGLDRLSILDYYAGSDGLIEVRVMVAHDAVFVGETHRMPITERVAGLIERDFLEVIIPESPNE